ncbi:glutathione S-transferase N-terminal domain-containing protein [Citreimonas sp.]|uniref:glutathione S-transferase N-terminal domain-containing protein n=1 Tax=Citreimonas sp. TaxID=3036715 RepID=UPI0040580F85
MRLFMSDLSPYARIVRVLIREIGIEAEIEEVRVDPRDAETGFWDVNPVARIPTLEVAPGRGIAESDLICRYLDAEFAQGRFYAVIARDVAQIARLGLAQSVLDRGVLARTEKMRTPGPDHDAFIQRQLDGARRGCDALDRTAPDAVEAPGIVDIVVACTLDWLDFRHPELAAREGRPRLAAWCDAVAGRPAMLDTRPS